jgi:inhibitor of KinA sporulation pathway (predicted exonuclease)|tara:strand:+ start:752 stop:967 length:216 start_codon:yes stop_codon:yes gene_type:complete
MDEQLEKEYLGQLFADGLSPDVTKFFRDMAKINQRTMSYFVVMAMEELKIYLEQTPPWDATPEEVDMGVKH